MNFRNMVADMEERTSRFRYVLMERFGEFEGRMPSNDAICVRCNQRCGEHYGTAMFLQCPDEWVADGHQLSL